MKRISSAMSRDKLNSKSQAIIFSLYFRQFDWLEQYIHKWMNKLKCKPVILSQSLFFASAQLKRTVYHLQCVSGSKSKHTGCLRMADMWKMGLDNHISWNLALWLNTHHVWWSIFVFVLWILDCRGNWCWRCIYRWSLGSRDPQE